MRRLILEFWGHMLPSRLLFPGPPFLFQQDNFRPHSARATTAWLRRHRVRVLDWLACCPDLSPIENVCRIIKKIRQWSTQTFEQLKSCRNREWAKMTRVKLQQLMSSVPKWLQSVIKRKGYPVVNMLLSQRFWNVLQASIICLYLTNRIKLISESTETILSVKGSSELTNYRF